MAKKETCLVDEISFAMQPFTLPCSRPSSVTVINLPCFPGPSDGSRSGASLVLVGTRGWLRRNTVMIPPELEGRAASLEQKGRTVVFVSSGETALGALAVADGARPEAKRAVEQLHR